jgi:hypothetical protein
VSGEGTDYNAHVKTVTCQWCPAQKTEAVGPLLLCPTCDVAVVTLAATSLGKPPVEG